MLAPACMIVSHLWARERLHGRSQWSVLWWDVRFFSPVGPPGASLHTCGIRHVTESSWLPRRSQELMKEMGREHFNCSLRPVSPRPGNLKGVREQLGESRKRPTAGQLCSRWPSSRRTFAKEPSEASWANAWSIQEGQLEYCDHLPEFSQLLKCFSCSALSRLFMLHLCGWSFFHGLPLRELSGIVVCTAPFIPLVPGSLGSRRWEEQALRRAEGSPAQPLS